MNTVSRTLRRLLGGKTYGGRALALVDLHPHTRGGHFGPWLRWFATELAGRVDDLYVVTPDPDLTRSLFPDPGELPNVWFRRLPRGLRKRFDLEALRGLDGLDRERLAAFVMWGYDLLDLGPARSPSQVPWATLVGMSWLRRGFDTPAAKMEARLLELFGATASCRAFLQFDGYVNDGLEKAIWVPDLEDVSLPARPTERHERIRAHAGDRPCVGAFGILTGYRCLDELLPLARAHPELRFALAGQLREETVAEPLRPLLLPGALENVLVLPGFMETEEELNDAIRAADAIFIDGARYPTQSGVVSKAVELGKCVVTPRANSWVCDFVRDHGVGVVYEGIEDRIAEALARWKSDGGEARSRAASAMIRDPRGVAACFDRLVAQLAKGWDASPGQPPAAGIRR